MSHQNSQTPPPIKSPPIIFDFNRKRQFSQKRNSVEHTNFSVLTYLNRSMFTNQYAFSRITRDNSVKSPIQERNPSLPAIGARARSTSLYPEDEHLLRKFNSPSAMRRANRLPSNSSVTSNASERILTDFSRQQSNASVSISIDEEMKENATVSKYSEYKFKMIPTHNILGQILGRRKRWKAGKMIGHGSMGQVYQAMDIQTGQIFAVKRILFNPNNAQHADSIREMQKEISLLKKLQHENIVRYLGSGKTHDSYYIYLEYMSGGSIASLLKKHGPLSENICKIFLRQILNGLLYLHSHKVLHRDIKGGNILVDGDGVAKLADFGSSKSFERSNSQDDLMNSLKGSVPWMAPEVIKQEHYGRKIDIWSLGWITIEMLTADHPWGDMDNHLQGMMKIALSNEIPSFPGWLSDQWKDFLLAWLQRDPKLRKNAKELLLHPFVN